MLREKKKDEELTAQICTTFFTHDLSIRKQQ